MLVKAAWILLIVTLVQFLILWTLSYLGIVLVGACGWGMWS